jgi:cell division protein FtsB
MARTTSTQRGASRRTTRTASSGPKSRGASTTRSRKAPVRKAAPRAAAPSRKRSAARRPAGPWVPIAVVALVAVLGWALYPAMRIEYQASRRLAGVAQQYDSLKQRNAANQQEVAALKTPAGVEKAARENLGYAKSGDNVYIVVPEEGTASAPGSGTGVSSASVAPQPPNLIQQFLDLIFGVEQPAAPVAP